MKRGRAPKALTPDPNVMRAAKVSLVPGMTITGACARFGVRPLAVREAHRQLRMSVPELALAALTDSGLRTSGTLGDLGNIAAWLNYVDKDDSTAADVRGMLETFVAEGQLVLEGERWTLAKPWP